MISKMGSGHCHDRVVAMVRIWLWSCPLAAGRRTDGSATRRGGTPYRIPMPGLATVAVPSHRGGTRLGLLGNHLAGPRPLSPRPGLVSCYSDQSGCPRSPPRLRHDGSEQSGHVRRIQFNTKTPVIRPERECPGHTPTRSFAPSRRRSPEGPWDCSSTVRAGRDWLGPRSAASIRRSAAALNSAKSLALAGKTGCQQPTPSQGSG
jgi:hypothetical protein